MNMSITFTEVETSLIESTAARLGVAPEALVKEAALKFASQDGQDF
jgi:hypothetical protein